MAWHRISDELQPNLFFNIALGHSEFDGTKPEPVLTYHQWSPVTFIWGQFHEKKSKPSTMNSLRPSDAYMRQ